MTGKRRIIAISFLFGLCLPLWGGTGRPSDGMLSFLLLLGFLLTILGLIHLADRIKRKLDNLLEGMI
jgi:purine-cytosine permease-like protein